MVDGAKDVTKRKHSVIRRLLCVLILCSSNAVGLPPEIELDRFIIAAKKHILEKQYVEAEDYLLRAKNLGVELPTDFYYAYGQVLFHKKQTVDARHYLETYVEKVGKDGDFYQESLELINTIEEKESAKEKEKQTTESVTKKAKLDWSSVAKSMKVENGYIEELKSFYLTQDEREALQLHINSLLSVYHIGNVPHLKRVASMSYVTSLSLSDNMIYASVLNAKKNSSDLRAVSSKFSVFGVNPYVDYGCESEAMNCWIAHPVDGTKWIRIINDSDAAKELVKALTYLIKVMQRS